MSKPSCELKEGDFVDVTTLVPNLAPESKAKFKIETQSASTIAYVRSNRFYTNSEDYMPGLNEVLVFGEDFARDGLQKYLDTTRVAILSRAMKFAVAEGRGEDILRTPIKDSTNMAIYLDGLLKSQKKLFVPVVTLHQFYNNLVPGKNLVLPLLKKSGPDQVVISGTAVFKKDRLISKLDITESRSLVLLRGLKAKGYIPFCLEKEGQPPEMGAVIVGNSRSVKVNRTEQNYVFNIKIKLQGTLEDHESARMLNQKDIEAIEKSIERDTGQECQQFVKFMQEDLKVDCIDINKYALAKWRKELTPIIDNEEFIQNAEINVEVKMHLKNIGIRK